MSIVPHAAPTTAITPAPGFVVKSRVVAASAEAPGTKVFLNIGLHAAVPLPPTPFDPARLFHEIMENRWAVPVLVLPPRAAADKQGVAAVVYDCVVNPTAAEWLAENRELRQIAIEWCLESVETLQEALVLDRRYTTPKMARKGPAVAVEVPQGELQGEDAIGVALRGDHEVLAYVGEAEEESEVRLQGQRIGVIEEVEGVGPAAPPKTDKQLVVEHPRVPEPAKGASATFHPIAHAVYALRIDIPLAAPPARLHFARASHTLTVGASRPLELPLPAHLGKAFALFYSTDSSVLLVLVG